MRPVSASRARNLITYLPGSSVKPVSYWIGRDASSRRSESLSLMSSLSRTFWMRDAEVVLHLADEVDERALRAAAARQRQLAARNLHRHRHEVLRAIQLEVVHLHRDRDVGDRVLEHQRLFELTLALHAVDCFANVLSA